MTDETPAAARRALEDHDAFEPTGQAFACTTTPFDATVVATAVDAEGRDARFEVSVTVPTLDAAVADDVADVVTDEWLRTFERRLADAYGVAKADPDADPEVTRDGDDVTARFRFTAWSADQGVADAKAIVDYVEGTYVQGVIPGYEYEDPVAGLLARATDNADDEEAKRGGTPL